VLAGYAYERDGQWSERVRPYLVGEGLFKTLGGLLLDLVWDFGVADSVGSALSVLVLHFGCLVCESLLIW